MDQRRCGPALRPLRRDPEVDHRLLWRGTPPERIDAGRRWAAEADAVVSIGSSLSVYPAAYIPLEIASRGEVFVIINNSPTDLDSLASLRLDGMAGTVFPQIVDAITS